MSHRCHRALVGRGRGVGWGIMFAGYIARLRPGRCRDMHPTPRAVFDTCPCPELCLIPPLGILVEVLGRALVGRST